jgi:purine-binding chemotaxis protein CheW
MDNQIVVFELGSEQYGVNIATVESIIKMQPITGLPHAPSFVEGVTNLRGRVLPVIDLHKRFGIAGKDTDNNSRIIIISLNKEEVGMIVDGVSEVLTLPESTIEPAPEITATINSAFITGIAKLDTRLIIMLDVSRILTLQEQSELPQLQQAG